MPIATPLTHVEKNQVRLYLGYSILYTQYNTYLEGVFSQLESSQDDTDLVRTLLIKIAEAEALILDSTASAGLKSVGNQEIEWYGNGEQIKYQSNQGRMAIGQLSIMLGVVPFSDYFGSKGFTGISAAYAPFKSRYINRC